MSRIREAIDQSILAMDPGDFREEAIENWRASAEDVPMLLAKLRSIVTDAHNSEDAGDFILSIINDPELSELMT